MDSWLNQPIILNMIGKVTRTVAGEAVEASEQAPYVPLTIYLLGSFEIYIADFRFFGRGSFPHWRGLKLLLRFDPKYVVRGDRAMKAFEQQLAARFRLHPFFDASQKPLRD
jgi:hypothetical protein